VCSRVCEYSSYKDIIKFFIISQPILFDILELSSLNKLMGTNNQNRISYLRDGSFEDGMVLNFPIHILLIYYR
jgi:hypothetical protein